MHKSLRLGMFSLLVLAMSLFGVMGFVSAAQPVLKAIPSSMVFIADGVTQYSITIQADSTPLAGVGIKGIQLDYAFPSINGYQFNYMGTTFTPQNDFFAGYNTQNNAVEGLVSRLVSSGPSNKVGNFVTLFFTITQTDPQATSKSTSLVMKDEGFTYFRQNSNNIKHYPVMQSMPFLVMRPPTRIGTAVSQTQAILPSVQESCPIGQNC